jgi:hypothetical protein
MRLRRLVACSVAIVRALAQRFYQLKRLTRVLREQWKGKKESERAIAVGTSSVARRENR